MRWSNSHQLASSAVQDMAAIASRMRAAADQVFDRDYPQVLRDLGVPILVVAVTYDAKTKEHTCRIFEA